MLRTIRRLQKILGLIALASRELDGLETGKEKEEKVTVKHKHLLFFFSFQPYLNYVLYSSGCISQTLDSFRAPDEVIEKGSYYISHGNNNSPDKASVSFICLLFQTVNEGPNPENEGTNIDK